MAVGYSGRSLPEKLGIKPGTRVVTLHPPPGYPALLRELPEGATLHSRLGAGARFIHYFARQQAALARDFPRLAKALADDGALWVSWPKQSSGVATDLSENTLRALGLPLGLVDVKVCAVDEIWSGLKFVRRKSNRR